LKTPLRRGRPELEHHAWLESADAHAFDRRSMEESIAGAIRELDKAVPFSTIVPFQLAPNRRRVLRGKQDEKSASIRMRKCRRMRDEGGA
jgi:hypothetical protein